VKGVEASAEVRVDAVAAPKRGELVFNEVLADVPASTDVNGDRNADATEDEFVELANAGTSSVDLVGATLWDSANDLARHTFAPDTVLRPGEAIVVFGGGSVASISERRCTAVVADNEDASLQHGLALNNEGDTLTLRDATGASLASLTDDSSVSDAAMVLDPEIDGSDYLSHADAPGSTGSWSPCTLADGDASTTGGNGAASSSSNSCARAAWWCRVIADVPTSS
jgi:hypothetical protein